MLSWLYISPFRSANRPWPERASRSECGLWCTVLFRSVRPEKRSLQRCRPNERRNDCDVIDWNVEFIFCLMSWTCCVQVRDVVMVCCLVCSFVNNTLFSWVLIQLFKRNACAVEKLQSNPFTRQTVGCAFQNKRIPVPAQCIIVLFGVIKGGSVVTFSVNC